jgi:hypothetical protein
MLIAAKHIHPDPFPLGGEREDRRQYVGFPLAPTEGERVGVRGRIGGGVEKRPNRGA